MTTMTTAAIKKLPSAEEKVRAVADPPPGKSETQQTAQNWGFCSSPQSQDVVGACEEVWRGFIEVEKTEVNLRPVRPELGSQRQ